MSHQCRPTFLNNHTLLVNGMNEPLTPEASNLSTFFRFTKVVVMHQAVPMFFIPSRGAAFKDHGIAASTMHANGRNICTCTVLHRNILHGF